MGETPRLIIPMGVNQRQLNKGFDEAVKKAENAAKRVEDQFAKANPGKDISKQAQERAAKQEAALQRETRAFERLRSGVDPAYAAQKRYETAVRKVERAVKMGAVSQEDANHVLELARAKHQLAAGATQVHAAAQQGFFKVSRQGQFVLQNTTSQVADMMVQFEMGTNPMRIMGQQLPQVFGGFGALGGAVGILAPLLGTVAAIGFPVVGFLMAAGDESAEAAEEIKNFADAFDKAEAAINRADAALGRLADGDVDAIKEIYGEVSREVTNLIEALARLEVQKATIATGVAWDKFREENTVLDEFNETLKDRLDIATDIQREIDSLQSQVSAGIAVNDNFAQIEDLQTALKEIDGLEGISDQFSVDPAAIASIDTARAALEAAMASGDPRALVAAVTTLRAALAEIPDGPLADMGDELAVAEDMLRRALVLSKRLEDSSGGVSFDPGVTSAARMADELNRAVDAMFDLRTQGARDLEVARIRYAFRDDAIGEAGALAGLKFDQETKPILEAGFGNAGEEAWYHQERARQVEEAREIARLNEASRPKRSGRGKAKSGLFQSADREIASLERQMEMVGKSRREVVALTAKYKLLDEAKVRGIDLDRVSLKTGRTVRDQIEAEAQSIADLTEELARANEQQEFFGDLGQDLKSSLVDAAAASGNLSDGLDAVASALRKAASEAVLFGTGPLAALFGGGSGLLGGVFKSIGFPGFAQGTDFAPGGLAEVGEQGRELVHLPRGSKVIPNHKLNSGGGTMSLALAVHPSGEFDARVERVSGKVAASISGQMITQNNVRLSQAQRRG